MSAFNELDSSDDKHSIRAANHTTTADHPARASQMEPSKPSSIYESPMFSIYAGPAGKYFNAHASILRESPMLAKIIDGKWKDSEEREIEFPECEEWTMHQLLDFFYFRHYHMSFTGMPEPIQDKNVEANLSNDTGHGSVDTGNHTTPAKPSVSLFAARRAHKVAQVGISIGHKPLVAATIDVKEELLATKRAFTLLQHSKLYVLAHYLQFTELEAEAYFHIKAILDLFQELPPNLLGYILQLIRHVYEHTDTLVNSKEPLRELVSTFAAKFFHAFQGDEVKELMGKGGDFVIDVLEKVQQDALDKKKERELMEEELRSQIAKYQKRLKKRGGKVDENDMVVEISGS